MAEHAFRQAPSGPLAPPKAVLSTYPQDYCGEGSAAELPDVKCRVVPLMCAHTFGDDGEVPSGRSYHSAVKMHHLAD